MKVFEKYVPYQLSNIVGAESYQNFGLLFKVIEPKHIGTMKPGTFAPIEEMYRFECWKASNYGKEKEKLEIIETHHRLPGPENQDDFENYVNHQFEEKLVKTLQEIPHMTHYIDNQDSIGNGGMGCSADYREIHIYESKTDVTYILLRTESEYFGHPMEGGYMRGCTFSKVLEVPTEQYNWPKEKLIKEYLQYFKK